MLKISVHSVQLWQDSFRINSRTKCTITPQTFEGALNNEDEIVFKGPSSPFAVTFLFGDEDVLISTCVTEVVVLLVEIVVDGSVPETGVV